LRINDLYRQVIIDHYKNPRNKGLLTDPSYVTLRLKNPSCGDDSTVQARLEGDVIKDVKFEGTGCSICCSSASVMSEVLKGKTISEAIHLYKLDNFSKVGVMKIEKINGKFLETSKVYIFPANDQSLLISLYGIVYVVDLQTMKPKKKINFGEEKSIKQIKKDKKDNNIFYAMSEFGNLYKFTLDGSVLLKNTGRCFISFELINDQKEIISDNDLGGVVIQSLEETE